LQGLENLETKGGKKDGQPEWSDGGDGYRLREGNEHHCRLHPEEGD